MEQHVFNVSKRERSKAQDLKQHLAFLNPFLQNNHTLETSSLHRYISCSSMCDYWDNNLCIWCLSLLPVTNHKDFRGGILLDRRGWVWIFCLGLSPLLATACLSVELPSEANPRPSASDQWFWYPQLWHCDVLGESLFWSEYKGRNLRFGPIVKSNRDTVGQITIKVSFVFGDPTFTDLTVLFFFLQDNLSLLEQRART